MMISKKPKPTQEQFLRGASRAAREASNGSGQKRVPFRFSEDLAARLKDAAWKKKTSVNALVIEILEKALSK